MLKAKQLSEHEEQKLVVQWCKVQGIPVASVPNGFYVQKHDAKFYAMLNKLKSEGFAPGFPDLMVFFYTSVLFIEMKVKSGGSVSDDQKKWHDALVDLGHPVAVCCGADQAIGLIKSYQEINEF